MGKKNNGTTKIFMEDYVIEHAKEYLIDSLYISNNGNSARSKYILDHSLLVSDYATTIAEFYKNEYDNKKFAHDVDIFACKISALFHDIADVKPGNHDVHNIEGAKIARNFLQDYDIPKNRIKLIENIILNHRIGQSKNRRTIEERILPNADSVERIISWKSLYELAIDKYGKKTADEHIVQKLRKSWNKLTLEHAKTLAEDSYKTAKSILLF